jgi:hypothetical protein
LRERGQIDVTEALAEAVEPLVVEFGKQVAAIERDRLLEPRRTLRRFTERVDVEPQVDVDVPMKSPPGCGKTRKRSLIVERSRPRATPSSSSGQRRNAR